MCAKCKVQSHGVFIKTESNSEQFAYSNRRKIVLVSNRMRQIEKKKRQARCIIKIEDDIRKELNICLRAIMSPSHKRNIERILII